MSPNQKNFYTGVLLAVLTTLIWSGNYVIARGISTEVPPVGLAFYRWGLASLCIAPIAFKKFNQEKHIIFQHKQYLLWTALTGVSIFNTFIYLAGHYTSAINLALIGTTSSPVFITLMAAFFLKEKVSKLRMTGMIICITGILFLISHGSLAALSHFKFGKGDVLILISAFTFAIYNILVRKKPAGISPMVFLFAIFTVGTLCLLPFYIFETVHQPPVKWNAHILLIILYLGIGNSIIAFFCWNASIQKLGASGTALFGNLIPIFSTIEAVLFLGEAFSTIHLISGLLVIGGLVIANITPAMFTR
ncbi:MAG: family transporter [Ferruginibacter sp.]|uniref:DMT family transporter n=1 Tax=Ferruginibacter sp. TaxID=1940288 RepID=UPI0026598FF3|nr:DMT family transporter [Ferruginibacter sp.]MDB5276543.1 family transporter [Ferruginibacter sp.]